MLRFTTSIRQAIQDKNWYSALFLALAVPDICGALEKPPKYKKGEVGERYIAWFEKYLKPKYDPDTVYESMKSSNPFSNWNINSLPAKLLKRFKKQSLPNKRTSFTAEDCFRLRNRCLHQGLSEKMLDERILFTVTNPQSGIRMNQCRLNDTFQLSVEQFCLDICNAVDTWLADIQGDVDIEGRMRELIEIYTLPV